MEAIVDTKHPKEMPKSTPMESIEAIADSTQSMELLFCPNLGIGRGRGGRLVPPHKSVRTGVQSAVSGLKVWKPKSFQ